jgi:hypothetical protein
MLEPNSNPVVISSRQRLMLLPRRHAESCLPVSLVRVLAHAVCCAAVHVKHLAGGQRPPQSMPQYTERRKPAGGSCQVLATAILTGFFCRCGSEHMHVLTDPGADDVH